MENGQARFRFLFGKYTSGTASAEEREEFLDMVSDEQFTHLLKELIYNEVENTEPDHEINPAKAEEIFEKITHDNRSLNEFSTAGKFKKLRLYRIAAAVLLGLIAWGGYLILMPKQNPHIAVKTTTPIENDVAPGHSGAILTLADGSTIVLDSAQNGLLASQGGTKITKTGARIDYTSHQNLAEKLLLNTMTTPKGRQFHLVLSDGSRVWLNAASSITFPATFSPNERRVEITGEVYFEIESIMSGNNQKVPFVVVIRSENHDKREIEVLGTKFNVNAYSNESMIRTTLLEGSIKANENEQTMMIKPGEQVLMYGQAKNMSVLKDADVDEAVAWKNGFFTFKRATIGEIMRRVERWYDVTVEYPNGVPPGHYAGDVPMNVNASEMLKVLQVSGIRFKIEGKKIMIQ